MADLVAFSELSLQLVFKVRQLKKHLPNDTVNQVLTDGLNESALYLELYSNEALNAKTERKTVEELRHAYQKTGSVRYYIEFLKEIKAIPEFVADDLPNRLWRNTAASMAFILHGMTTIITASVHHGMMTIGK